MLKRMLNELMVSLNIAPDGPVLIKSGSAGVGTDMCFVTAVRNGKREVYLPGSSLKGVIRSHCEKICRTLQPRSVCQPFNLKNYEIKEQNRDFISCSQIFTKVDYWKNGDGNNPSAHYSASCPACRMFGSLKFKGRCFIDDAYVIGEAPLPHIRDGVGIDRFTGAASRGAKYEFEVITDGKFSTQLHLVNFEMWQLELLTFALRDLVAGDVRIGMATSRGLGKIKTELAAVEYCQWGKKPSALTIADISALETDAAEADRYGFYKPSSNRVDIGDFVPQWQSSGIGHVAKIPPEKLLQEVAFAIRGTMAAYLDANPGREKIKEHYYQPQDRQNFQRRQR